MTLFNITRRVILPLLAASFGPACLYAAAPPATSPASAAEIYQAWPYDAQEAARRQEATARSLGVPKEITAELGKDAVEVRADPGGQVHDGHERGGDGRTLEGRNPARSRDRQAVLHGTATTSPRPSGGRSWDTTVAQQREKKGGLPPNQPATASFIDHGKFTYPKGWDAALAGESEDHPMYFVTWDEATEFCRRVSEKAGRTVRLPTEAQWEYAAQAGSRERFFFGADAKALGEYAWYTDNDGFTTAPRGRKKSRIPSACMTSRGMCGRGVRIGTASILPDR